MQLPLHLDRENRRSLQTQIFEQLRELILAGKLRPGTTVPPTRTLAQQLAVSRNTAMLAYDRLINEGYLQTRAAVGTFVSFDLPEESLVHLPAPDERMATPRESPRHPVAFKGRVHAVHTRDSRGLDVDFWVGRPAPRSFPAKTWRRLMGRHLLTPGDRITDYGNAAGLWRLRESIAEHLGSARGISVTADRVMIVSGTQEALNVIARLFVREKTPVAVECPCYQGAAFVLESYGAKLLPVLVDEEGLNVDELPENGSALIYVTPSHQYPLGTTLSLERRLRLIDWARRTGAYIVEDDYDSDFRYQGSPLTAVKGLHGGECVIYLGTFSKSVGAGLRIGYMVLPEELVEPAWRAKALMDNGHPWLEQAVLADFISSGAYASHLRRIRRVYMGRRDALADALQHYFGNVKLTGLDGGMHLAWHLGDHLPTAKTVQEIALQQRVGAYALEAGAAVSIAPTRYDERALMLGYAACTPDEIWEGIGRIARAISRPGKHALQNRAARPIP
jgi:GntR family transcriptional regulator/MocR family aminotransferase